MSRTVVEHFFNTSTFFSGCFMLLMNLGSKHIHSDVPKGMELFFSHPVIRRLTLFSIVFIATRDFRTALLIVLLFILLSKYLMNENSKCCLPFVKENFIQNKSAS